MSKISKKTLEQGIWGMPCMLTVEQALEKMKNGSIVANVYYRNEYFSYRDDKIFLDYPDSENSFVMKELPLSKETKHSWMEISDE